MRTGAYRFVNIAQRKKRIAVEYTILGEKRDIALVHTDEVVLRDAASALEFMMSAQYETGCRKLILPKACVAEAFFSLRTGLAGEILQKFVNYQMRLAIVGEYDHYTSKPLQDFIRESNRGRESCFLPSVEEAVRKLT